MRHAFPFSSPFSLSIDFSLSIFLRKRFLSSSPTYSNNHWINNSLGKEKTEIFFFIYLRQLFMEFSNHGGGGGETGNSSRVSFFYLPSAASNSNIATVAAAPPPGTSAYEFRNYYQTLKAEGAGPSQTQYATKQRETVTHGGNGDQGEIANSTGEMDRIKAKIMSHPQYSSLLAAYLDCQKVISNHPSIICNLASNGFLSPLNYLFYICTASPVLLGVCIHF